MISFKAAACSQITLLFQDLLLEFEGGLFCTNGMKTLERSINGSPIALALPCVNEHERYVISAPRAASVQYIYSEVCGN